MNKQILAIEWLRYFRVGVLLLKFAGINALGYIFLLVALQCPLPPSQVDKLF